MMGTDVFAQANRTNSGDVVCPATGSSIEILPARTSRYSYLLNNTSAVDVRIGFLSSGTGTLTGSNSWILRTGQATADSAPGVFTGRLVCMSSSASTATITFNETYR